MYGTYRAIRPGSAAENHPFAPCATRSAVRSVGDSPTTKDPGGFCMQSRTKTALASLAVLTTVGAVAAVPPANAAGGGSGSTVIARGLGGPFGVQKAIGHRGFVVAESMS